MDDAAHRSQQGWLLLACVALSVALNITAAAAVICPPTSCDLDPARVSLTGIDLGQAVVVILAVVAMSSEYSSEARTRVQNGIGCVTWKS